ncbi:MAG: hypothetical protein KTR24_15115 [Saprospiraceae bacterium]|nr:hypothetical protein [Saprospiraceae bacterium]
MEGKDIQEFDDFVRSAMDKLEVGYDPASWHVLQEKWSEAQTVDVDQIARDALAGFTVPYDPASWDAMEEKWTAAQADEIDATAREALSTLEVPYEPASWTVLLERLENIEYKRRLVALKILEAAVVLLLLVTIGRFTSPLIHSNEKQENRQDQYPTEETLGDKHSQTEMAMLTPATSQSSNNLETSSQYIQEDQKTVHSTSTVSHSLTQKTSPAIQASPLVSSSEALVDGVELSSRHSSITSSDHSEAPQFSLSRDAVVTLSNSDRQSGTEAKNSEMLTGSVQLASAQVDPFDLLVMRESEPKHSEDRGIEIVNLNSLASQVSLLSSEALNQVLQTRIGIYSQVSRHYMQSNMPFSREKFSQRLDDIGVGFTTNVQFGRVGFDLGMGYERMEFQSGQSLANNLVQKVHLPFHMRANILHKPTYNVYAKAGVVAHGVLYANYAEAGGIARGGSNLNQVRYNDGLLVKNGVKENNFYMMKSAGLGIDGRLSEDFSIFLEGLYQDNLSGSIGGVTTNDQLQMESVVLVLGIFYNFDR